MGRHSRFRKKFIRSLAGCYVFFKVVGSKPRYRNVFIGCLVGIVLVIVASIGIVHADKYKFSTEAQYESLREDFVVESKNIEVEKDDVRTKEEIDEDARWSEAVWSMEQDADDALWYGAINVDLERLKEVSSDIIGWIYFEAADISYPVLNSGNNDTYLRATYDGQYATAGSIFMEEQNKKDFSDKHTLIYGHNMRNNTMFGQLKLYKTDEDYYSNHQYFQLIHLDPGTGDVVKERYHIFACKDVAETDYVYQIFPAEYTGIADFANKIRQGNYLKGAGEITVGDDGKIITLSTCSSGDNRFIVSAVKCGECIVR